MRRGEKARGSREGGQKTAHFLSEIGGPRMSDRPFGGSFSFRTLIFGWVFIVQSSKISAVLESTGSVVFPAVPGLLP